MQELVNRARREKGLPPVMLDPQLCLLSEIKARDMAQNRYFGHQSERLGSMCEMVSRQVGERGWIGENIGLNFSDEEEVHHAWMNSALHRKNILHRNHNRVGFAWAQAEGAGRIYVQVFTGEETGGSRH
jgi:uncharacterized protein YkwD